jgi:hypothetical protein
LVLVSDWLTFCRWFCGFFATCQRIFWRYIVGMSEVTTEQMQSVTDAIAEAAVGPKRVSSDQGSVEQHPLQDLIAAERHLATKRAMNKANRGLRFTTLIPPGAV